MGQGRYVGGDGRIVLAGSGDMLGEQGEEGQALKTEVVEPEENCLEEVEIPVAVGTSRRKMCP